jgi:hypothetical protein
MIRRTDRKVIKLRDILLTDVPEPIRGVDVGVAGSLWVEVIKWLSWVEVGLFVVFFVIEWVVRMRHN